MGHRTATSLVIVVGGALALFGAFDYLRDFLFYPWALQHPPVMGGWVGPTTPGNGVPIALWLDIERTPAGPAGRCTRCNQLAGRAATCDGRGVVRHYRISGSPEDRHAQRLHLGASPEATPAPDGLELSTVEGRWDGADRLTMEADFFWRKGASAISSTDDPATQPVPVALERKPLSVFESMCADLRKSS